MKNVLILIVSYPGDLQNELLALLTTIPQIQIVLVVEEAPSALRIIATHRPGLVLLDMNLPVDHAPMILRQIKTQWPEIQAVAFADTVQQKQEAETLGVNSVLFKGFQAAKMITIIEEILANRTYANQ